MIRAATMILPAFFLICGLLYGCDQGVRDEGKSDTGKTAIAVGKQTSSIEHEEDETTNDDIPLPMPDIALQVNVAEELSLYTGAPLIITVRLANQRAANVLSTNATATESDKKLPVPVVRLGEGWPSRVGLKIQTEDGRDLAWPVTPLQLVDAKPIELDGENGAEFSWSISPEASATLSPGVYHLTAVLDTTDRTDDEWHDRMESEPVMVTFLPRPENLQGSAAIAAYLEEANYWNEVGNWNKALELATRAVSEDPGNIKVYTLIGDAQEGMHDYQAALAAYQKALFLYLKQEKAEIPNYLTGRISQLQEALEAQEQ